MHSVLNLFAHQVYEVEMPNFKELQQGIIDEVSENFNQDYTGGYVDHEHPIKNGSIAVIYDLMNPTRDNNLEGKKVKVLHDFVMEHCKNYWNILGYSSMLNPYVLQLWITASKRGGFVASHNHNPMPIAGVFYISAEEGQGNLLLENPSDLIIGKAPYEKTKGVPNRHTFEVEARTGKLILFPGWMKHSSKANNTDDLRMSMAVNFGCHGQVYHTDLG